MHPIRSKPYRNSRIITVIRDVCFTGGGSSLANRYHARFPSFQGDNGLVVPEVPIALVALVATAVRAIFFTWLLCTCTNTNCQLYASIYEWRTGRHQPTDFSANAFLDVYNGHMFTFHHISENRNSAFHRMMADIYVQAR